MSSQKQKNLRFKGKQWQLVKKLPNDVHATMGKQFYVKNLGTADLLRAMKLRDRLLVELDATVYAARRGIVDEEQAILEGLQAETDEDVRGAAEGALQDLVKIIGEELDEDGEPRPVYDPEGLKWYFRVTGQAVPIGQYLDRFLRERPAVATTQLARRVSAERFTVWLQGKTSKPFIQGVTKKLAGDYASHLTNLGLAQATVNVHLSHLSGYWKWMVKRGLVTDNVWQGQQMTSKGSAKKRHAWTMQEASYLIENAPTRLLKHAIAIAALSGMRAAEITSLRAGDCRGGIFKVKVHERGKTDSATRHVPIHSYLGAIIESRLHGKRDEDFLLHETKGNSKALVKRFAMYRQKLYGKQLGQADKTLHSFRHSFVTEALRAGCDVYLVKYAAGHKPEGVTLSVYHKGPSIEQLRKVVESVMLE